MSETTPASQTSTRYVDMDAICEVVSEIATYAHTDHDDGPLISREQWSDWQARLYVSNAHLLSFRVTELVAMERIVLRWRAFDRLADDLTGVGHIPHAMHYSALLELRQAHERIAALEEENARLRRIEQAAHDWARAGAACDAPPHTLDAEIENIRAVRAAHDRLREALTDADTDDGSR